MILSKEIMEVEYFNQVLKKKKCNYILDLPDNKETAVLKKWANNATKEELEIFSIKLCEKNSPYLGVLCQLIFLKHYSNN